MSSIHWKLEMIVALSGHLAKMQISSFHQVSYSTHWLLERFAKSAFYGHFGLGHLGWISAKLPFIWSKMRLQHKRLPFLPPTWRFSALWLGHAQKSKFWTRKWPASLGFSISGIFFRLSFLSFSLLFAAMIDLPLCLLWESVIETGSF